MVSAENQQFLASSHRAETWQLGITFLAWFDAAIPVECIRTHEPGQVHLCASWHKTNTTTSLINPHSGREKAVSSSKSGP